MSSKIKITPLGAGSEVGRSCILLSHTNNILLDCGIHPAYTGVCALPFLDTIDLSTIDAVLITHFHLDHAGALPYLTEKTQFNGKIYMTHPTKAILRWLLSDYVRVINCSEDFYTEEDLENCYEKIIAVEYNQEIRIGSIRIEFLNAGHVLGAAMFLIEVAGTKILYTGDYSREEDRHLKAAEWPGEVDVLIAESTYGVQCHLPRAERENRLTQIVSNIVLRGGRCLLPVFALGRAQELLLILDEHWEANKNLQKYPIFYASILAQRCMAVFQTYLNMMNERIKKISLVRNPFVFRHIQNLQGVDFDDSRPCVMIASPGMLQSGFSRQLFDRWCEDSRNGTVITGYCVTGTVAKDLLNGVTEVEGRKVNSTVEYISFSAHVDFMQNSEFIKLCNPKHLLLVHGEINEMQRLKAALSVEKIYTLKNGESLEIEGESQNQVVKIGEGDNVLVVKKDDIRVYGESEIELSGLKKKRFIQRCECKIRFGKFWLLKEIEEFFKDYLDESNEERNTLNKINNHDNNEDNNITKENHYRDSKLYNTHKTECCDKKDASEDIKNDYIEKSNNIEGKKVNHRNDNTNNELEGDINLLIKGVKVRITDTHLFLEWEAGYMRDLIAYTIDRMAQNPISKQTVLNNNSSRSRMEILGRILRNYYKIEIRDKIYVEGNISVEIKDGNIKVTGTGEKVKEVADIIRLAGPSMYDC